MSRAKGYTSKLALAYESAYGQTPASPVGYNMPFNQSKIAISQNLIDSSTIRSRRDKMQPSIGNIDVSGNIVVPVDQIGIGFWLRAMFDNPTTTGSADPYTHVFKATNSQPSLVLEQQYPDVPAYEKYNGCKVNKFSITYGGDDELTANMNILGAKRTVESSSFDATLTDISILKYSNFQGSIEEGGSQLATVPKPVSMLISAWMAIPMPSVATAAGPIYRKGLCKYTATSKRFLLIPCY